ncbi:MAG: hypothetical protein KGI79_03685 [Patescibacteria group bacterium]|nr:hypothetical protein [Patescibacteria group bacterium]
MITAVPFGLSADQLAEMVADVLRISHEQRLTFLHAARKVGILNYPGADDALDQERDRLVDILVQGAETLRKQDPAIAELHSPDREQKSPPRRRQPKSFGKGFIAQSSEKFDRLQDSAYQQFHMELQDFSGKRI